MKPCYIFDIDGTLSDPSHRLHHLQSKPKDWDSFFGGVMNDTPHEHIVKLALDLYSASYDDLGSDYYLIVFVTGRPERVRMHTLAWLEAAGIWWRPRLYMRADGDRRDDNIVKFELLQQVKADGFEPIMAFDDRKRVVDMWRANGVPCAQVAPGDF